MYVRYNVGSRGFAAEMRVSKMTMPELDNGHLKTVVEKNPQTTVRELEHFRVGKTTVERHMELIGKVKKLDKRVSHELNEAQKQHRMEVSFSLFLRERGESFLDLVVNL